MKSFQALTPTRIIFGAGALEKLTRKDWPGHKLLFVTSNGASLEKNGTLPRVREMMKGSGCEWIAFPEVEPNPSDRTVMRGAALARRHAVDGIVAVGGGSVMDAAKLIAAMATNPGDLWDYAQTGTGKRQVFFVDPLPLLCVTTTAGTGSEVDAGGVISNHRTQEKLGFGHPKLFPTIGVVDPTLMLTVPPHFTAYQGFDALMHSMEGYVSKFATPMSDTYALSSVEHLACGLARAVQQGNDLEARSHVAYASTLAGLVMVTGGLTSQHAFEHSLSALQPKLPHGAGLILLARTYFSKMIEKGVAHDRFIRLAKALGMENAKDPMDAVRALGALEKACGVDTIRAQDWGIDRKDIDTLVANVMATGTRQFERDIVRFTEEEAREIFTRAIRASDRT